MRARSCTCAFVVWLAFLATGAALVPCAFAATFNVANFDIDGLKAAITASNTNNEDDIINLAMNGGYALTQAHAFNTGLPFIESDNNHALTINGNGAIVGRSFQPLIP